MKRKIAAITFLTILSGTAFAGPIESIELPTPPEQRRTDSVEDAKFRGLIEDALNIRTDSNAVSAHKPAPAAAQPADWTVYSSAELWLEGIPESDGISLDTLAQRNQRNPAYASVKREARTIPTVLNWNRGPLKANFETKVMPATQSPTAIPADVYASGVTPSGGTGAIDGRVEYDFNTWQLYGVTKRSVVANADGTISGNNIFAGGSYFNLPSNWLGGKLGTGFEVDPGNIAKTRIEYRHTFGKAEGFLAAEHISPNQQANPDANSWNALKAGINRKF